MRLRGNADTGATVSRERRAAWGGVETRGGDRTGRTRTTALIRAALILLTIAAAIADRNLALTGDTDADSLADQIRAALAENRKLREARGPNITASERALADALDRKFQHYLDDPETVDLGELRNVELMVQASGRRRVEVDGHDPYAAARVRRLELLARIRADVNETKRNNPQFAHSSSVIPVTLDIYKSAQTGVLSRPVSTVTKKRSPVGRRLRKARERAGFTKYELAKRTGFHSWQILQWERGDHVPTATSLRRLTRHIGGTTDYYLFGDDEP